MKQKIHPKYYPAAVVTCACGNTFTTGSTDKDIQTEVCSACHPFFTGQARFIDTQGRVERFQAKQKAAGSYQKKKRQTKSDGRHQKTLKEMLTEVEGKSTN